MVFQLCMYLKEKCSRFREEQVQRPKIGTCLVWWRNSKEGTVALTRRMSRREVEDEVRVAARGQILRGLAGQWKSSGFYSTTNGKPLECLSRRATSSDKSNILQKNSVNSNISRSHTTFHFSWTLDPGKKTWRLE